MNTIINDPFRMFFVMMAIIVILIVVGGEIASWFKKPNVIEDEFADFDDQFAELYHEPAGVDEFADLDDVYSIAVKPTYKSDDEFRRIDLKSFTCINCSEQERCPMAFDFYCTDGDCGMK